MDPEFNPPVPRIDFEGALNFRDLGGHRTRDGRRVANGRVYRSDALWQLTDADLERLAIMGLRTVCDFRAEAERLRWPNRLPLQQPVRTVGLGFSPRGTQDAWDAINAGKLDHAGVLAYMRSHYCVLAEFHTDSYAQMFEAMLLPDGLPTLFHCASGKDRTGWAAAVILLALDVPRESIVADYMISDRHRRELSHLFGPHVDPLLSNTVAAAHHSYLEAAFELMDRQWGGEDRYLREALRLSDTDRDRLRTLLLE